MLAMVMVKSKQRPLAVKFETSNKGSKIHDCVPQQSPGPRCASALREICAYSLPDQGTLHFGNFYYFRLHVIPKWVRIYSLNPQGKEKSYSSNFDVQKKMCDFPPVSFKARRW